MFAKRSEQISRRRLLDTRRRPLSTSHARRSSPSQQHAPHPQPGPGTKAKTAERPRFLTRETVYPFVMLSIITSLALNLRHSRSEREASERRLGAQVGVLEQLVAQLRHTQWTAMTEDERTDVERRLELVGLGAAKGRDRDGQVKSVNALAHGTTSWKEVLLGRKGQGFEQEKDDTDWDKGQSWRGFFWTN